MVALDLVGAQGHRQAFRRLGFFLQLCLLHALRDRLPEAGIDDFFDLFPRQLTPMELV